VESYGTATQITDDKIIRHMRFACWINKATNTHSEYVILIAFPLQQWSRERASMLRSSAHCLSIPHNLVMMLYDCHNQQRLFLRTDFTYRFFKERQGFFCEVRLKSLSECEILILPPALLIHLDLTPALVARTSQTSP